MPGLGVGASGKGGSSGGNSGCGGAGGMVGSGAGGPGGIEFRKAINGKYTNKLRLRNRFNLPNVHRVMRCITRVPVAAFPQQSRYVRRYTILNFKHRPSPLGYLLPG
jgi:hypothetical protein